MLKPLICDNIIYGQPLDIFIPLVCQGFSALVENSQQMLSEIQSSLKNVSDIPTMHYVEVAMGSWK